MPDDALIPDNPTADQFDRLIEAVLADAALPPSSPDLEALARIASDLRDLPHEDFQQRLKFDLQRRATMTTSTMPTVREGHATVVPFIAVPNAPALIDFLKQTFGAEETRRPRISELRIGDSEL